VALDKDLMTALVHLYRGELGRMTVYRQRLDATTHLSVVTLGAFVTFVLGREGLSPHVLGLGLFMQAGFLLLEATRYRRFATIKERVRLLECGFYGDLLGSSSAPGWQDRLRQSIDEPEPALGLFAAVGIRLRIAHLFVVYAYAASWALAVARAPGTWLEAASAGPLPGAAVAAAVALLLAVLTGWAALRGTDFDA
jgi:uncharacterized membrane protein